MALTVIVGVVDSPEGGAALDRAVDEVRLRGGTLVVVHSSRGGHEELEDVIVWQERLEETDRRLTDDGIPIASMTTFEETARPTTSCRQRPTRVRI